MEKKQEFKVGNRAVVFDYTNTEPKLVGTILTVTEHFVEIHDEKRFGKNCWHPKSSVEVVKSNPS